MSPRVLKSALFAAVLLTPGFALAANFANGTFNNITGNSLTVGGSTVSLGGNLTTNGALTFKGAGTFTLPAPGTLLNSSALPSASASQIYGGSGSAGAATPLSNLPAAIQSGITQVGTLTAGTWNGTSVGVAYGGTGASTPSAALANLGGLPAATAASTYAPLASPALTGTPTINGNALTLAGAFTTSGAYPLTFTQSGATNITWPSGTNTIAGMAFQAPGSVAITGGTINGATVGATTSGTGKFTFLSLSSNFGATGANPTPWINENGYLNGYTTTNDATSLGFGSADQLDAAGGFNYMKLIDNFGGFTSAGSRNVIESNMFVNSPPNPGGVGNGGGSSNYYVASQFNGDASAPIDPDPLNNFTFAGHLYGEGEGGSLSTGATNWYGVFGIEPGVGSNVPTGVISGIDIIKNVSSTSPYGRFIDSAISVIASGNTSYKNWQNILQIGEQVAGSPTDPDSTVINFQPRQYATGNQVNYIDFDFGIDARAASITSGGAFLADQGFGVDFQANTDAQSLTSVGGTVQAASGSVSGVSVSFPGDYDPSGGIPTFTITPPVNGNSATTTVATMQLTSFVGFGATGKNYAVNDVLTFPCTTGTSFTYTVTSVDAYGGITGWSQTTAGACTNAASNPIYPTGGSGRGAAFKVLYTQSGADFVPLSLTPATTGSGNAVGDVITLVGDTGTAGSYTVNTVDSYGGIEGTPTSLSVNNPGSLTAYSSSPCRAYTTSGSGTGGSIEPTYGVATVNFTGGSGYDVHVPPRILSRSQGAEWNAQLVATVSPSYGQLTLNPSGGNVQIGPGTAIPTNATTGFLAFPFTAAAPTGACTATGGAKIEYNPATHSINVCDPTAGAWYHATLSAGAN